MLMLGYLLQTEEMSGHQIITREKESVLLYLENKNKSSIFGESSSGLAEDAVIEALQTQIPT